MAARNPSSGDWEDILDNQVPGEKSFGAFDQRISNGLSDLINGALGIRRSKIPKLRSKILAAKEKERQERQGRAVGKARGEEDPGIQVTLQFPINYFRKQGSFSPIYGKSYGRVDREFPNSIHFRTLTRKTQDHSEASGSDAGLHGTVNPAAEHQYDIFLHLPEKLQDEVKVEYSEAKGGAMAQFMARMFSNLTGDRSDVNNMEGKMNIDANEILTAMTGMFPGGDIIQKASGHMTNPMLFQAMKNVNFRSYNYSFQLKPTSPQEADMIRDIVFAFKKSMLPGTAGENHGIWTLPNEWSIQFAGPIKNWIDFPLTAVCTSCTVDYGQYLMAGDKTGVLGRGAPSSITLALNFIETTQLSRQKFAHEVGNSSWNNRQSKSEESTKIAGGQEYYSDSADEYPTSVTTQAKQSEMTGGQYDLPTSQDGNKYVTIEGKGRFLVQDNGDSVKLLQVPASAGYDTGTYNSRSGVGTISGENSGGQDSDNDGTS